MVRQGRFRLEFWTIRRCLRPNSLHKHDFTIHERSLIGSDKMPLYLDTLRRLFQYFLLPT